MSMLAEPRRKQKIAINPRGNLWSKDENKLGQQLLKKMGWSEGKGLGAKLDGSVDHVKVTLKSDTRGVGFTHNHADNWLAHQDDFNSLLANLNKDHSSDATNEGQVESKINNLQEKAKTSKGKVHYQKFAKGKDLSLKSETDLDCVFGKRKIKGEITPQAVSEANSGESDPDDPARHGITTVNSTDSIQEYFAKKMAEMRKNREQGQVEEGDQTNGAPSAAMLDCDVNEDEDSKKEKKKSKKKKRKAAEEEKVSFVLGGGSSDEDSSKIVKKSKKKKRRHTEEEEEEEVVSFIVNGDCDISESVPEKKKVKLDVSNEGQQKNEKGKRKLKDNATKQAVLESVGKETEEKSVTNGNNLDSDTLPVKTKSKKKSKKRKQQKP